MRCPQCAHENPQGVKFCGECGARLQALCPACGVANPPANKFCGECGAPMTAAPPAQKFASPDAYTPKHLAEKILTSKSALEGERKSVTVMFSDVSGFTAMSEKLDPEEVHAVMDRAFEVILNEVHRYEGTINQCLGDGVMALFGAPIAHEDYAHRALSAALAMQRELKPLAEDVRRVHSVEFRMRLGITTGLVVAGAIRSEVILNEVHRYEGTINQFLGDGVMALFGAPIAHEDHAHRALSAALAIQRELKPLAEDVRRVHSVEFRMRMGINTGLVVVGAIGKDLRMDY